MATIRRFLKRLMTLAVAVLAMASASAQTDLKVGSSPGSILPSAVFEAASTSKGLLIPRMTTAQRTAIASPALGLLVFDTDLNCLHFYFSGWKSQCDPANLGAWGLLGNTGTTASTSIGGAVGSNNFIGTKDAQNFTVATNNLNRFIIDQNGNAYGGGNGTKVDATVTNSFAWGNNNNIYGANSLVVGDVNIDSSKNAFVFGNNNVLGSGLGYTAGNRTNRGTILGGGGNVVVGGETYNSIITGSQNSVVGNCFESIISGYLNTINNSQKTVVNGQLNSLANASYSTVFGSSNSVSSLYGLAHGRSNTISTNSTYSLVMGESNTVSGLNSSIVGGFGLRLGNYSIGYNGFTSNVNLPNISANSNVAYFGDVDMWLGNVNNAAKALRFYEPNTSLTFSGANYTAFRAGAQATDLTYTWPTTGPTTGQQLNSDAAGNLSWASPSAFSWNLLGNGSTVDGTNFLGTTDAVALNFRTNNQKAGRIDPTGATGATFLGYRAGNAANAAFGVTAVGYNAGLLTTANNNSFFGYNAGQANIVGSNNSFFGTNSGYSNTGIDNTFLGHQAGFTNGAGQTGTFVGSKAGYSNTTASNGTFIGFESGYSNSTGANNVTLGYQAGWGNSSGSFNTYLGMQTAYSATTASSNTIVGYQAGNKITTGDANAFFGNLSGFSNTTGTQNAAFGFETLLANTTGSTNTAIGYQAGRANTTGTGNTFLGNAANASAAALTNATAIGSGAIVNASNKIRLGNASITSVETYGTFTTISDRREKMNIADNAIGLEFIKNLRPVQYELKSQKGIRYDGFVAQEIDSTLQKMGIASFSGLKKPDAPDGLFTVSYSTFVVPLVNAVKELDQKNAKAAAENLALKKEIELLKNEKTSLRAEVEKNTADIEAIKKALFQKPTGSEKGQTEKEKK